MTLVLGIRSYGHLLLMRLMLVSWRNRIFIVVSVGLATLWWLARYWHHQQVDVSKLLSLHVYDNHIQLRLSSPDGNTRLRGSLGSVGGSGVFVAGSVKSCSVDDGHRQGVCAEVKNEKHDELLLRLEVTYSDDTDCYRVKWRPAHASKNASVMDCYQLDDALWYSGTQVFHQRWPINAQTSAMQPHVTGDYLLPKWRSNPTYGRYGSIAEPYWLSSHGVAILVDEHIAFSSSFNAAADGRLCLKGDRTRNVRNLSSDGAEIGLLSYTICRGSDIASVHQLMSDRFFPRPKGPPDSRMMRKPIWSTWALYKADVNQSSVEKMAQRILHYNFPHSQLEIDDRYTTTYGQFDFDVKKFPNASDMIRSLHDRGFRVTTWITPFSNLDCPETIRGTVKKVWLADNTSTQADPAPALTSWWRGEGFVLDVTSATAKMWFSRRLRQFSTQFGVDSFKFDAGEVDYLPPNWRSTLPLSNPSEYTTLYVHMAATFGRMIEVRAAFRSQLLPVFVRMLDKDSAWGHANGLRSIIPTALASGIAGYPFVLPDMIGGNGHDGVLPDRELFIRWTELTAFLPAMQFSLAPWQYDAETVAIARKYAQLHATTIGDELEAAAKDAVRRGSPIIRPLWWLSPTDDIALKCDSQFLIGDRLLVAPVLHQGARSRDVYLPGGPSIGWKDYFARDSGAADVRSGGTWVTNKHVALDEIAVFIRVMSTF